MRAGLAGDVGADVGEECLLDPGLHDTGGDQLPGGWRGSGRDPCEGGPGDLLGGRLFKRGKKSKVLSSQNVVWFEDRFEVAEKHCDFYCGV